VGGTVLDRRTLLSRQLKPAAKTLGLGNVNWHLPRHSNATLHDSIGTPLGTVQALLGHSSSEITRQVYLHSLSAEVAVEGSINYWTQIGPKFWIWATGASRIR
jgi:integrase